LGAAGSTPDSSRLSAQGGNASEFSVDGLSFNPDGTFDFGGMNTYNADVGGGFGAGDASGFGSASASSGVTPNTAGSSSATSVHTPEWTKDPDASTRAYSHRDMNTSAQPSPPTGAHPGPLPYNREQDQPRPQPARRGRGRAGNWKSESILRPTRDVVESEVRRRTFWHAYCEWRFLFVESCGWVGWNCGRVDRCLGHVLDARVLE
jgi:hypothetical protein